MASWLSEVKLKMRIAYWLFLFCSLSPAAQSQLLASLNGMVVDGTGATIAGAGVKLSVQRSPEVQGVSGGDGRFSFEMVPLGAFRVTVSAPGFAPQTYAGTIRAGETFTVPNIVLPLATLMTDVQVSLPRVELAQEQIKAEEKQRILRILPNFNVSYEPNAVALTSKQKFELAFRTTVDPFTFVVNGIIAGVQQKENSFSGFGQGASGYAKRYGASYASFVTGTMISSAMLPSLLKQDPRYFVKGVGTKRTRVLYALSNSVIRRSDKGAWQPNYSGILGGLAAGGISSFYYPAKNRNGAGLTFENAALGIGADSLANVLQEFLFRKLTPKRDKGKKP